MALRPAAQEEMPALPLVQLHEIVSYALKLPAPHTTQHASARMARHSASRTHSRNASGSHVRRRSRASSSLRIVAPPSSLYMHGGDARRRGNSAAPYVAAAAEDGPARVNSQKSLSAGHVSMGQPERP